VDEMKDPLNWIYNEKIFHTPSTAGSFLCHQDSDYGPADNDISLSQKEDDKRELKRWLSSTNYEGRWRSTDNYCSLSRHNQITFRNQMKAIFRHVLCQFAPNDIDAVWEDIIDDGTEKPDAMIIGYVFQ
jgi:hypothetical protein